MRLLADLCDGLASLRAHRARATSTVLGVAWGTFAVVGLGAFSTGLEASMAERAAGMGQGIVIAWPRTTGLDWQGFPAGRHIQLTAEDVRGLRDAVPGITHLSPEHSTYATLRRGGAAFRPEVTGVDPDYGSLRSLHPAPGGRFLNGRDLAEARPVVFLGDRVARQLFGAEPAVGRTVHLEGRPLEVVGQLAPKEQDSDYGSLDEARIFLPLTTYRELYGGRFVRNFVVRATAPEALPAVIEGIRAHLGRAHHFAPHDPDVLNLWDTTEGDQIRGMAFGAMRLLMLLAGTLTVLVGAIGVGNLMFLTVRRRTGELGLRLALGARPSWVLRAVLLEAVTLVALGGLLGFLAAAGLSALVGASPLAEDLGQPTISPTLALGAWSLLAVVGLIAGWFPARRAARLDPAQALTEAT